MTTTKPLAIGRHIIRPEDAASMIGTHLMVYDLQQPVETQMRALFGLIGDGVPAAHERLSRTDAVLFLNARDLRERLRALCIAVRREQDEYAEREKLDLLDTTALAALSMAERTLEDLDNQIGE